MLLLKTAKPKENLEDPTDKTGDISVTVTLLLPPRNDWHKRDYINKK